jgi:isopenicillin N synthase-like dioxygenase
MTVDPSGIGIPVVDVAAALTGDLTARQDAARAIRLACRDTGFFYVIGHGIDPALIEQQFAWAKRFFDLPLATKQALDMKLSPSAAGYEPIGGQVLDSQDPNATAAPADLKEGFYIGAELPDDHPLARLRIRSYGHNQWPAELPQFRNQMLAYRAAVQSLADQLLALLARSLDLPEDWFAPYFANAGETLRLIKYPPHPAAALAGQLGAGAHTDWGGFTILAQDDAGGLEVRNVNGEWLSAVPIPGSFVINLGDLMARWTNGIYMSNMHRVLNNRSGRDRYSVPYFYGPQPNAVISAIPTCVDAAHPPKFATCTAAEHVDEMFARSYGYRPNAANPAELEATGA